MKNKFILLLIVAFLISTDLFAKPGSSSGRSSGFGSRSYSSGSSYKSSGSIFRSSNTIFSNKKPSGSNTVSTPFKFGSKTKSSTVSTNSKLFDTFKSKYSSASAPPKHVMASDLNKIFNRDYRKNRRTQYYSGYRAPAYATTYVQTHSNYGMWDAMMMWSILDNMGDRRMYYNHMDDPEFRQWRTDADALCSQGNTEVCNKLASLDKEVKDLTAKGIKKQAGYITEGVDPNIYISDSVKLDNLSEIKICTGTSTSDYTRFAGILAKATSLKVKNVQTSGSIDNLYKLSTGECDMAFTQSDALTSSELVKFMQLETKEDAMLICNKNSGVQELSDLSPKTKIYIGSDQTGSLFTFNNLKAHNVSELGKAVPDTTKPTIAAADSVNNEDNTCLFTVTTYKTRYVQLLNDSNKSVFVPIDAEQSGYERVRMDWTKYSNLVQSNHNGWWDKGSFTPAVYPVLVTTSKWIEQNPVIYYDVLTINKDYLNKEMQ